MGLFLGIDLGTSYFKAGLFDEKGRLKGIGRKFVNKVIKNNISCELPVAVFWKTIHECIWEAIQAAQCHPWEILSVSYSSQANSFIFLDRHSQPLTPLILWPDKRAGNLELPEELVQNGDSFMELTGLGVVPNYQFGIAKIDWFQKLLPDIWQNVESIMSISDYFTFVLTGHNVSDYSTTAMTGMFDSKQCQWWNNSLDLFNLRRTQLPDLVRVGTKLGYLTAQGAMYLGLEPKTLFCVGGLDHHMAAIGAGIIRSKRISESTGTVLACVNYQERYSPQTNCCVAPGLDDMHYFKMLFDENGAASLEWYQKEFSSGLTILELLQMAENIEPGSDGLVSKRCAHKYPLLSGFTNIEPYHGHGHFVRAILESTAFSLLKIVDEIKEPSMPEEISSTGGGAQSSLWIRIKADMLGSGFYVPECRETACLGAAMLGATSSGETGSLNETMANWVKMEKIVTPDLLNHQIYKRWIRNKNVQI